MSRNMETSVLNVKKIRKLSIPYMWVWAAYYAWVLVFTVWWTAIPGRNMYFTEEYRGVIHTVNMISSAVCVMTLKKEQFTRSIRISTVIAVLMMGLFFWAPTPPLKMIAAALLGLSLGCINISILFPFVFMLNNTEKLFALVMGHVLSNAVSLLICSVSVDGEQIIAASMLAAALFAVVYFRNGQLSGEWKDKLVINNNTRAAIILTILTSTLGAILFLGADKAILNIYALTPGESVMIWYFLGGLLGSLLYGLIFALPRMNAHMALSLPFGCLALGLLCSAFVDRIQGMARAFSFLLGMGTIMGMSTVYYILGVAGKKHNSMLFVRLCILIIGIFGGVSSVMIGDWVVSAEHAMQISLIFTVASSAVVILVLVFSSAIAKICFDDTWAGDAVLPEVRELQAAMQIVNRVDELEGLGLTPREKEVCMWLLRGFTVRQISGELGLAFATVNGYYRSLYRKLGINSKVELFMRFGTKVK